MISRKCYLHILFFVLTLRNLIRDLWFKFEWLILFRSRKLIGTHTESIINHNTSNCSGTMSFKKLTYRFIRSNFTYQLIFNEHIICIRILYHQLQEEEKLLDNEEVEIEFHNKRILNNEKARNTLIVFAFFFLKPFLSETNFWDSRYIQVISSGCQ